MSKFTFILLITLSSIINGQTFNDIGASYHWEQVKIGAGGWLVGMDMQKEGNVIYCRAKWRGNFSSIKKMILQYHSI